MIYSLDDFDRDLDGSHPKIGLQAYRPFAEKGVYIKAGDCIISMTRTKAAITTSASEGKLLTVNFMKCEIDQSQLDPWYFCYLFNESNSVKQQMQKVQQGTVSCISRLNITTIGALKFERITLARQREIGQMYREVLIQEQLRKRQTEKIKKASLEIIRRLNNQSNK